MEFPHEMTTLSEAIDAARKKGFLSDFVMTDKGFMSREKNEEINPEDLTIKKVFRFEGMSDPNDMSILYLMESKSGLKGIFVDAFGTYGDFDPQDLAKYLQKVKIEEDHFKR